MSPILIESIEVTGRIKGCTFSLMLFFTTPVKLITYSDACHSALRNGLDVLLIDHQLGHRWFSSDVCPTWLIEVWSCITDIPWPLHSDVISNTIRRQYINAFELLAVLVAVFICVTGRSCSLWTTPLASLRTCTGMPAPRTWPLCPMSSTSLCHTSSDTRGGSTCPLKPTERTSPPDFIARKLRGSTTTKVFKSDHRRCASLRLTTSASRA
jgi:hypothetical protein